MKIEDHRIAGVPDIEVLDGATKDGLSLQHWVDVSFELLWVEQLKGGPRPSIKLARQKLAGRRQETGLKQIASVDHDRHVILQAH
jgi:hypothetical protein